ncbi:MAG: HEAT repeat domain-containing protein [Methanomicrobiaceae archaeon]|nr:HEAT repeat domain-containing protein [Methanomicrobiaceae archaeon]
MNTLLERLDAEDIRMEGACGEVAADVLSTPSLLPLLAEGMGHPDGRIRARTSHAMERIACADPELVRPLTARFIELAGSDPVPVVRWRYAVILGCIPYAGGDPEADVSVLLAMLHDRSVLVRRWAIVSLTDIAWRNPDRKEAIAAGIRPLADDPSAIVRVRASRSLDILD